MSVTNTHKGKGFRLLQVCHEDGIPFVRLPGKGGEDEKLASWRGVCHGCGTVWNLSPAA